jgi:glycerol-3-phosphate dehydrogenase subunit C
VLKQHFETAIKVGRPAARQAAQAGKAYIASECPLAGQHLLQGIDRLQMEGKPQVARSYHPIELFAKAYGLAD